MTAITVIAAMWVLLGIGVAAWMWIQDAWSRHQHGADRCACGMFGLTGIDGQRTTVAIHRRDMCAPHREMIP